MSFEDNKIRFSELRYELKTIQETSKGNVSSLDENNDGNNEISKVYTDDGATIFEEFDFDSNGAIDYQRYFNENGETVLETFYTNDPKKNETYTPSRLFNKVLSFFGMQTKEEKIRAQADKLSKNLTVNPKTNEKFDAESFYEQYQDAIKNTDISSSFSNTLNIDEEKLAASIEEMRTKISKELDEIEGKSNKKTKKEKSIEEPEINLMN